MTIYARTHNHVHLKNLKKNIYLFIGLIYLFPYRFFGEKRLTQMQEFSVILAAICLRKENCVNIALFILTWEFKTHSSQQLWSRHLCQPALPNAVLAA